MSKKINDDYVNQDTSKEYFKEKDRNSEEDDQSYFPPEESKPPHF